MSDILNSGKTPMQTVLKLAVPSIMEQLLLSLAGLIDTAMVGTLGAAATASIGHQCGYRMAYTGAYNRCQRQLYVHSGKKNRRGKAG